MSADRFRNARILLPAINILERFQSITGDMLELRQRLMEANTNLKVHSGQVVAQVDIGEIDFERSTSHGRWNC